MMAVEIPRREWVPNPLDGAMLFLRLRLFQIQGGKCYICDSKLESLALDHDHRHRRTRALLCARCNNFIGCIESGKSQVEPGSPYLEYLERLGGSIRERPA
jgi:Recombination endonuclease VII